MRNRNHFTVVALLGAALLFGACNRTPDPASLKTSNRYANSNNSSSELIDLNSASKNQLMSLPGIGEVHAQKIIDGRPYREKSDLVRRNIISENEYEKITDKIIARQK